MRQALRRVVDNLCAGRVEFLAGEGDETAVRAERGSRVRRPHSHSYMEIVQRIDGGAALEVNNGTMPLRSETTCLVLPGCVHCEQPTDGRKKYRLLWGVVGPGGISFFSSVYRGAGRYPPTTERFTCHFTACEDLWAVSTDGAGVDDPIGRAKLQALVTQACAQAVEDMDKTPYSASDHVKTIVDQVRRYLHYHYREPITVDDLAQMARCTPNYLNTAFRRHTGMPIHHFLIRKRLKQACELLRGEPAMQIKQIAYEVGFTDPLYFSRLFRKYHRVSPSRYRGRSGVPEEPRP